MIRKWFDWTPGDIAYWEKIRAKGLGKFILRYGIGITGGGLFLAFGSITTVLWVRQVLRMGSQAASWLSLVGQLLFVAMVCLMAGIINSLVTWWVEQHQYRKYAHRTQ